MSARGDGERLGAKPVRFSPQVERALAEVVPSSDPIDSPDFDAVDFINQCFPDERSLEKLPAFADETNRRLVATEAKLMEAVRSQATTAGAAAQDLQQARGAVVGLYARVSDIRTKAEESEEMVRALCLHIRQLDLAKTNLSDSIRALKSVQLWIVALRELKHAREARDYARCNDNLRQGQAYAQKFDKFADVPKIKELQEKQQTLCRQLEFDIKNLFIEEDLRTANEELLRDACLVIDAIGAEAMKKIRTRFINKELAVYDLKFKRGTDDAKLEKTASRYAFIRNLLETNDTLFSYVFPRHWCVQQELCVEFCVKTHRELAYQLQEASGNVDVAVLVYILQKTIEIEKDLTARNRWRDGENTIPGHELPDYRYAGMILACFESHMGLYVREEDRAMEESIGEQTAADRWPEDGGKTMRVGVVLSSSEDLFVFIKESLKRVVTLRQQSTLEEMVAVWRKHLVQYANLLSKKLPQPPVTPAEFVQTCVVINTADNCLTTSQALSEEVSAKLGSVAVNYDDVVDAFSSLYSSGTLAIVVGIEKQLEGPTAEFMSERWLSAQSSESRDIVDESRYVTEMRRIVSEKVLLCAGVLLPQFLRFLLDKLAATFIPRWCANIYRLRRVTDAAVSQIRLDCAALEKLFLQLPNLGNPDRFAPSMLSNYSRLVRREFERIHRSLKVLQCELGEQFVTVYYELIPPDDRSIQDFSRLLELKGVKREDSRPWVTQLTRRNVPEATKRDTLRDATWEKDQSVLADGLKSKFEKLSAASIMIALRAKVSSKDAGGGGAAGGAAGAPAA